MKTEGPPYNTSQDTEEATGTFALLSSLIDSGEKFDPALLKVLLPGEFNEILSRLIANNQELAAERKRNNINSMTGLPNGVALKEMLVESIKEMNEPGSNIGALVVFTFDINNILKTINDQYGHPEGDRLLGIVAPRIQKATKRGEDQIFHLTSTEDTLSELETKEIVSHPHGDEFISVLKIRKNLSGLTPEEIFSFLKEVRERIEREINTNLSITTKDGKIFPITVSIGNKAHIKGQKFTTPEELAEELISQSDESQAIAKRLTKTKPK